MNRPPEIIPAQFTVSEWADGTPFLSLQEDGPETNTVLNNKNLLAIHLERGTTIADAQELARFMNRHITKIGLTFLP